MASCPRSLIGLLLDEDLTALGVREFAQCLLPARRPGIDQLAADGFCAARHGARGRLLEQAVQRLALVFVERAEYLVEVIKQRTRMVCLLVGHRLAEQSLAEAERAIDGLWTPVPAPA